MVELSDGKIILSSIAWEEKYNIRNRALCVYICDVLLLYYQIHLSMKTLTGSVPKSV